MMISPQPEYLAVTGRASFFPELQSALRGESVMAGRKVVMLGAGNYLGLTTHPKVAAAAKAAVDRYGTGISGSRSTHGTLALHGELEARLAAFFGAERALVFGDHYLANIGVISALGRIGSYLISDRRSHESILDGQRTAPCRVFRFDHNDVSSLRSQLEPLPERAQKWVIVEGVYGTYGNLALLPEIVDTAHSFNAEIILDDAHGVGVMGFGGRGTASHFGLADDVAVVVGTLGASFASQGGFAIGSRPVIEKIAANARSFLCASSLSPMCAAAALAALDVVDSEPEWLERLWANTKRMKDRLRAAGLLTTHSASPIIAIPLDGEAQTREVWEQLMERGVYVDALVPPSVQNGQSLLRLSTMATLEDRHIDFAADVIAELVTEARKASRRNPCENDAAAQAARARWRRAARWLSAVRADVVTPPPEC
ncbi:MAG TPA: aminotransferase class I/II-fold pyridoxal phosphate-dependent enzyme [Burkholderiales bacterium]|nr:aminotransferase class I/II-fold pyridoxal phosphate-dependent enzyme [Burkholderiales bacterium]